MKKRRWVARRMRRREKRGTRRCGAGRGRSRAAGTPWIISCAYLSSLRSTDSSLSWVSARRSRQRRRQHWPDAFSPEGHPQTQLFQALAGLASFGTASLPPQPVNRVTNHHVPTLARGVQAENSHVVITNVIKRYNWIAYQPVEFTNCNVAGAPYATSDPVFSPASARLRVRDRFLPQRTFD